MYKVKIDQTLCRMIEVYRRLGLWRNEEESDLRSSCIRILYFLQYLGFSLYLLMGTCHAYLNKDVNRVAFLFEAQIIVLVLTVKLVYLLWRKDEMLKFLNDPIVAHCTEDYGQLVKVNNKMEKVGLLYKAYTLNVIVSAFFEILLPLTIFTNDVKMLPAFIRFRMESDYEMIFYCMLYIYGSVSFLISTVYIFFILFIWYIMYNFAIEYKLLGHRFRSLHTTTPNTYLQELIQLMSSHHVLFE